MAPTAPAAVSPAPVSIPSTAPRYVVDAKASEIRLLAYRDGPLARFGHNHVVAGRVHLELDAVAPAHGESRLVFFGRRLQAAALAARLEACRGGLATSS